MEVISDSGVAEAAPDFMQFNSDMQVCIINTPDDNDVGDYNVRLTATLDDGTSAEANFLVAIVECEPRNFSFSDVDDV